RLTHAFEALISVRNDLSSRAKSASRAARSRNRKFSRRKYASGGDTSGAAGRSETSIRTKDLTSAHTSRKNRSHEGSFAGGASDGGGGRRSSFARGKLSMTAIAWSSFAEMPDTSTK